MSFRGGMLEDPQAVAGPPFYAQLTVSPTHEHAAARHAGMFSQMLETKALAWVPR